MAAVRQPASDATAPAPLGALLALGRPAVMGILNVTPDSFSDGGDFRSPEAAIAHARKMADDGADILDIGAESSRPYIGATPVSIDDELTRLKPVLAQIVALGRPVSIDSMKAKVTAWALEQGAAIANDVWGLQRDPDMARVVAERGVPVIVMHNRNSADPTGIGFGKTPEQSMIALARLDALTEFGLPVLVGASRKRFIDTVVKTQPKERLPGSLAAHLVAADQGAAIIRAHDVAETVQALRVAAAIRAAGRTTR
jgi:dihydropteroate synthase